jgi:hypothetical protein
VLHGETWEAHGRDVAAATPFLPSSFDRPPHNIAEKINSGYKAWEWLLYLYGLAPALLYGVLPEPYYSHFCKLVRAICIIQQRCILADDLLLAGNLLQSFVQDFEALYYQGRVDTYISVDKVYMHYFTSLLKSQESVHLYVLHSGPWNIPRESRGRDLTAFQSLSQRGLLRCQVNALKAMIPDLDPPPPALPRGVIDLGQPYALLRAQDRYARLMRPQEADALLRYLGGVTAGSGNWCPKVTRWARWNSGM